MRTTATALIVLAVCIANRLAAAEDAKDITFILTTAKEPPVYNIGERVEVDAAFSTKGHGYCFNESGSGVRGRTWRQTADEFRVVPVDGGESVRRAVYDPYFDELAFAPLIETISKFSSVHPLSQRPRSVHVDLNEWVRITAPGKYRVTARSSRISRCSSGDQPPRHLASVRSNEVQITILPVDGNWAASELQEIRGVLDFSSDESAKAVGARRLSYLNTRDSTSEMAARFVANDTPSSRGILAQGLLESSWRDTAIAELEGSLQAREKQVPQSIYHVLAMLLVAREFQDRPLPEEKAPGDRQRAIEARGDRFNSILAELYLVRPNNK